MRVHRRVRAALFTASALVLTTASTGPALAVAGGADTAEGALPFVARLDMGDSQRSCSGVLVSPQLVLTAASCFAGADGVATTGAPPLTTTVTVGRTVPSGGAGGAVSGVGQVIRHPQRDLALARLEKAVTTVAPVAIAPSAPAAGDELILAGFGRTGTEWVPNRLKSAAFTVDTVTATGLAVTPTGSGGICKGDAGGPALRRSGDAYQLVGLHWKSNQAGCLGEATGAPLVTEARVDDVQDWVRANLPGFATGFEAADARANWVSAADTGANGHGGVTGVGGIISTVAGPELATRAEQAHSGTTALMYSGKDTSATRSYAYMKAFSLRNLTIRPSSTLSYWIFPQSVASNSNVTGANSTCVAVDLSFTDGTNLRDSGATDQNGNRAHPQHQCAKLTRDTWNEVIVPLGAVANGKTVDTLAVAYDQAAGTGGYRGYVDDLALSDVLAANHFGSGLETGETALGFTSTADSGTSPHGGLLNVGGIIGSVTGPELATRTERAYTGTTALMYSGKDNNSTKSYAYMKAFAPGSVFVRPGTRLTYRVFPQSVSSNSNVTGGNSSCVALDLIFLDQPTGAQANLRDTAVAVDRKGVRAHPGAQCGKLTLDTWNEITVDLGSAFNGKQITLIDVGYDQAAGTGGYRGYIDDIRITDSGVAASVAASLAAS
ncbi:S1 family peptidase [Paractinoplanes hotanensis]|uniref:Trypsin-like serine protease n=1 Tax=Paractinoplanes hotanensis TaxID=2906497 RepID=A0ABT0XWH1_9ACTN|nr:trypsin-like serine protease [Actinoplanes hotanensis]MCM4078072.1 trypsin-like serine protease [Actinoplanes hotanensis]